MVGAVVLREGELAVGAVHGAGRGVDEVFRRRVAAALEHVEEGDDVRGHVGHRLGQRPADAGLGREMDDAARPMALEQVARGGLVGEIQALEDEAVAGPQRGEPRFLEADVVVGREAVDADDRVPVLQEPPGRVIADEAGRAGDEDRCGHGYDARSRLPIRPAP